MKQKSQSSLRQQQLEFSLDLPSEPNPSETPAENESAKETPAPRAARPRPRQLPSGPDAALTQLSRDLVTDLGLPKLAEKIRVNWNSRLRTTAGRAYQNDQLVELNPGLVEISQEEIDRTLRHELAHLVAYHRAAGKRIEPHGPEWKKACADLGIPGEDRCHDLPFERRQQKRKFAYKCPHCGHQIQRVRRIRRAAACFECCKKYNRGNFDSRFELSEIRLADPAQLAS